MSESLCKKQNPWNLHIMKLSLPWRWHYRKRCNANILILSVIGLCCGISASWKYSTFYANGAATSRRSSNQLNTLYCSNSPADIDQKDTDEFGDKSLHSAKFTLSGSICGQNREYLLDNLTCGDDCEIQFCG